MRVFDWGDQQERVDQILEALLSDQCVLECKGEVTILILQGETLSVLEEDMIILEQYLELVRVQ